MTKSKDPEERTATVSAKNKQEGSVSPKVREVVSKGATANPDDENTVAVAETGGETTVYRIFRRRHLDGEPTSAADEWIRYVKRHCTSTNGELTAAAVWTDVDGGSVLVAATGPGIMCRKETAPES